jgi:DNA-binding NarL/FixJ family response regulator
MRGLQFVRDSEKPFSDAETYAVQGDLLIDSIDTHIARVLIADDHAPTRQDIRRILEADGRFSVCAEAADAAAAVAKAVQEQPDIVLLDIQMPGQGLAALWEISARLPNARIVMLTVSENESDLFAALRGGAHGYLLKDIDPQRLPEAVFDVYRGGAAIPRPFVSLMIDEFRDANPRHRAVTATAELAARLTSREWQVLDLLARDNSTAEIADHLVLSQSAVRAHIAAVVRKLDVRDRTEAVTHFRERSEI